MLVLVRCVTVPIAAPVLVLVPMFVFWAPVFLPKHGAGCDWPSEIAWRGHKVLAGPIPVPITVEMGGPNVVVVPSSTSPPPVAVMKQYDCLR